MDAYDRRLVKQIEVASATVEHAHNKPYVRLLSVSGRRGTITARVEVDVESPRGIRRQEQTVQDGDNLEQTTRRTVYADHFYEYDSFSRLLADTPVYAIYPTEGAGDQTWTYDKLGSMRTWRDPSNAFKQFSLGDICNGLQIIESPTYFLEYDIAAVHPQALYRAYTLDSDLEEGSYIDAEYDTGGYMSALSTFSGCDSCDSDTYTCSSCIIADKQVFIWDEAGRLQETYRLDGILVAGEFEFPDSPKLAHYQYTYDAGNMRIVKINIEMEINQDLYISSTFELRKVQYNDTYGFEDGISDKYLEISGKKVARLLGDNSVWAIYTTNHLGSTSVIVDSTTGEAVESDSNLAFGYTDETIRTDSMAWSEFKSYYGFIGNEEDESAGIIYSNQRYYIPNLGRWASSDPLGLSPLNINSNYIYVSNSPVKLIDPTGLEEIDSIDTGDLATSVLFAKQVQAEQPTSMEMPDVGGTFYEYTSGSMKAIDDLTIKDKLLINKSGLANDTIAVINVRGKSISVFGGSPDIVRGVHYMMSSLSDEALEAQPSRVIITKAAKCGTTIKYNKEVVSISANISTFAEYKTKSGTKLLSSTLAHEMGHPLVKANKGKMGGLFNKVWSSDMYNDKYLDTWLDWNPGSRSNSYNYEAIGDLYGWLLMFHMTGKEGFLEKKLMGPTEGHNSGLTVEEVYDEMKYLFNENTKNNNDDI